jgi:hypothetical protein
LKFIFDVKKKSWTRAFWQACCFQIQNPDCKIQSQTKNKKTINRFVSVNNASILLELSTTFLKCLTFGKYKLDISYTRIWRTLVLIRILNKQQDVLRTILIKNFLKLYITNAFWGLNFKSSFIFVRLVLALEFNPTLGPALSRCKK